MLEEIVDREINKYIFVIKNGSLPISHSFSFVPSSFIVLLFATKYFSLQLHYHITNCLRYSLVRLLAKAIYKFTSTSKSFSLFKKETYFASKQAQNSLLRDDTCFFIQPDITQLYNVQVELHPLLGEELTSRVPKTALGFLCNSVKILSSSNGLILCRAMGQNEVKLFITNPATQSCLPIPTPDEYKH